MILDNIDKLIQEVGTVADLGVSPETGVTSKNIEMQIAPLIKDTPDAVCPVCGKKLKGDKCDCGWTNEVFQCPFKSLNELCTVTQDKCAVQGLEFEGCQYFE